MSRNDLEERLIDFAELIVQIIGRLPITLAGKQLGSQLLRSGTSPALNYGLDQGAGSRQFFFDKIIQIL